MSLTHKNDTEIMRRLIADPGTWVVVGLSNNTERDAHRELVRALRDVVPHDAVQPHRRDDGADANITVPTNARKDRVHLRPCSSVKGIHGRASNSNTEDMLSKP